MATTVSSDIEIKDALSTFKSAVWHHFLLAVNTKENGDKETDGTKTETTNVHRKHKRHVAARHPANEG